MAMRRNMTGTPFENRMARRRASADRPNVPIPIESPPGTPDSCPGPRRPRNRKPLNEPLARQAVRYLRTSDRVRLAWAEVGRGPTLVKAANWMTHLEFEWNSPVWRHWIRFFSGNFRFVRYDERG